MKVFYCLACGERIKSMRQLSGHSCGVGIAERYLVLKVVEKFK